MPLDLYARLESDKGDDGGRSEPFAFRTCYSGSAQTVDKGKTIDRFIDYCGQMKE